MWIPHKQTRVIKAKRVVSVAQGMKATCVPSYVSITNKYHVGVTSCTRLVRITSRITYLPSMQTLSPAPGAAFLADCGIPATCED